MDPLDGLAQQGRDREDVNLFARRLGAEGDRIGHREFLDLRFLEPLDGRARQDRVGGGGVDMLRPLAAQGVGGLASVPAVSTMSSSRIAVFPSTAPMMFITSATLGASRRLSMMAREAERRLAKARARSTPRRPGRRSRCRSRSVLRLDVFKHHRRRVKVVHRDVEESLDLPGVKVHRQQPGDARRGQEVGHELRRDGARGRTFRSCRAYP